WTCETPELPNEIDRTRCMMQESGCKDDVSAVTDVLTKLRGAKLGLEQLHVLVTARCDAGAGASELRIGAIDSDDAIERRREHIEQRSIAGACIDHEAPLR